jgi:hypothetical protein
MIRKPTERDFEEGGAIKALRETRKITVEGSKGIGAGISRIYATYFAVVMTLGFCLSLAVATSGLALIPMGVGGVWWWKQRKANEAADIDRLRGEQKRIERETQLDPRFVPNSNRADPGDVAFPSEVRRSGSIEADIGSVIQQAFLLLTGALLVLFVFALVTGFVGIIVGSVAMMLAALIGSRAFGHRKLIEWDTRKIKVWHLLGEAEMQWADVTEVMLEKRSRLNLLVYFQSGSRRNVVIRALVNRLGGPLEMRVPIGHMNLTQPELQRLLRDLICWRAAGNTAGGENAAAARRQSDTRSVTPLTDPRESFDPDAIMARYLREREETLAAAGRANIAAAHVQPSANPHTRPVFGRKRA